MIPDAMLAEWEARAQQIGDWPMRQAIEEIRRLRGEVARTQGILQGWITTAVTRGDALAAHQAVVRELASYVEEGGKHGSNCDIGCPAKKLLELPLVVAARKAP